MRSGFTGHEQVDALALVHMGGRVYNPLLGRFLSADPFVQAPAYSQSHNRYAYVLNNPLGMVDPSGFWGLGDLVEGIGNAFRAVGNAVGPDLRRRGRQAAPLDLGAAQQGGAMA